jgi:putative transposase
MMPHFHFFPVLFRIDEGDQLPKSTFEGPSTSTMGMNKAFLSGWRGEGLCRFLFSARQKEWRGMNRFKRAYHYRFVPTEEQKTMLARTFGCCRYLYNWALNLKSITYRETGKSPSFATLCAMLPALKTQSETAWLASVSAVPLQQSLRHLERAFVNFFAGRASYPTFKTKHGSQSATYTAAAFTWREGQITLAKTAAPLAIRWSRPLPAGATPSTVTISRDRAGRYFVSILVEEEITPLPISQEMIGIDLGLTSMVITSQGEKVDNPKYFVREEKKLARAQKRHAKKQKGSRNRERARRRVAMIHARIADRRRDYQHKLSTKLIRENQVICVESLAVKNMMHHPTLAKAIADVGWGEFLRQLEYKAEWYGRTLVKIDRWFPSSKTCAVCGDVLDSLDLDAREWTCSQCGTHHDRDLNAARVRRFGIYQISSRGR